MPPLYQYYPLARWDEFEMLCRDLWSAKYSVHFQLYGKRGSDQHGVDSFGYVDGGQYVLQCKGKQVYPERHLLISDVRDTVNKVKDFPHKVSTLFIATTASRATILQDDVIKINNERRDKNQGPVVIYYWDEIQEMLSQYTAVTEKYYPMIEIQSVNRLNILSAKTKYFRLYVDKLQDTLILTSCGDDVVIRIGITDLTVDWMSRVYSGKKLFNITPQNEFSGLIEVPIHMLLNAVQAYMPNDKIYQFRTSSSKDSLLISRTVYYESAYCNTAICEGIYYSKEGCWYNDHDNLEDPVTSDALSDLLHAMEVIGEACTSFIDPLSQKV